jgi:hypothetical protein
MSLTGKLLAYPRCEVLDTDALATNRRIAVGVLLTHGPPCPPPSRVPSPGYAFPQQLTRVTIVI